METGIIVAIISVIGTITVAIIDHCTSTKKKQEKLVEKINENIDAKLCANNESRDKQVKKILEQSIAQEISKLETRIINSRVDELSKLYDKLDELCKDLGLTKAGLQEELKNTLHTRYDECIKAGFADNDMRDRLERMYTVYHTLGPNGVMDDKRAKFFALPVEKASKNKTKK